MVTNKNGKVKWSVDPNKFKMLLKFSFLIHQISFQKGIRATNTWKQQLISRICDQIRKIILVLQKEIIQHKESLWINNNKVRTSNNKR